MPRKSAESGKDAKRISKKEIGPAEKKKTARKAIPLKKTGKSPAKKSTAKAERASSDKNSSRPGKSLKKQITAKVTKRKTAAGRSQIKPAEMKLPESYGNPKIVLMPVDPYLMHVYWEVEEKELENTYRKLRGKFKELQPSLRFFDVTGMDLNESEQNIAEHFDVAIDLSAGNWYVHLRNSARDYIAELGIKTEGGTFSPLIRSNKVTTPTDTPRPREPERVVFVSKADAQRTQVPLPGEKQRVHYVAASFAPKAAKALRILNQEMQAEIRELPEMPIFESEEPIILHSIEGLTHINENIDVVIEKSFTPGISSGMIRLAAAPVKSTSKK